jgi:cytochrome c oxidase assembly protein subunit 15
MHMTLASAIFMAIVWVAASLGQRMGPGPVPPLARRLSLVLVPLILLQIFLGGLVAGLDAGLSHNTWPLMDGSFIPPLRDLYVMQPSWVNHFENAMMVQFQHRMVAYLLVGLSIWQAVATGRSAASATTIQRSRLVLMATLLQAFVGISTLLMSVPLWAGLVHQLCAIVLLAIATVHAQALSGSAGKTALTA